MKAGYYKNIPSDDYHGGDGISKSGLDLLRQAPALLEWSKNAPRDDEAVAGVDIGDAFHAIALEPHRFRAEYAVAPEVNRVTTIGKNTWAEFCLKNKGKKILNFDQGKQLRLMHGSAMAHPWARMLLTAAGDVEPSIYWIDQRTGILCRMRPDKLIQSMRIIVDVKTTADMERFSASVNDYRYHVQDAFYSEGYERHFADPLYAFIFVVVSTSRSMGRYPVRCFSLTAAEKNQGRLEFIEDLATYELCKKTGVWSGIESLERPSWAKRY